MAAPRSPRRRDRPAGLRHDMPPRRRAARSPARQPSPAGSAVASGKSTTTKSGNDAATGRTGRKKAVAAPQQPIINTTKRADQKAAKQPSTGTKLSAATLPNLNACNWLLLFLVLIAVAAAVLWKQAHPNLGFLKSVVNNNKLDYRGRAPPPLASPLGPRWSKKIIHDDDDAKQPHAPPDLPRHPPPLPMEDDDDEVLCDCGWTRCVPCPRA